MKTFLLRHSMGSKISAAKTDSKPGGGEANGDGKIRGLGDVVERVTRAVGIKQCGGCKKRQAWLNDKVPLGAAETKNLDRMTE